MCVRINKAPIEADRNKELGICVFDDFSKGRSTNLFDDIAVDIEIRERRRILIVRNVKALINGLDSYQIFAVIVKESAEIIVICVTNWRMFHPYLNVLPLFGWCMCVTSSVSVGLA